MDILTESWNRLVTNTEAAWQNVQDQTAAQIANDVVNPATNAIQQISNAVSGLGQSQSDVKNISNFTDTLKKYFWVIPVVVIVLMLVGKLIFSKKSGR